MRGCLAWQREGLAEPSAVVEATEHYRGEQDALADFLTDCCVLLPGIKVTATALFSAYTEWAAENGDRPLGRGTFGKRLQEGRRIFQATGVGPKASRGWEGIGLKDTRSEAAFDEGFGKSSNIPPSTATDVSYVSDVSDPKIRLSADPIETRDNNWEITSITSTTSTTQELQIQNKKQIQEDEEETIL